MPKSLIYCRVSSDRQVKEGHGLDGQEQRCRKYAAERGYTIAAVFRDEGVSGGIIDRDGMQSLLDFLDKGNHKEPCVVIIDDIKRLARDLMGHFTLRKAIQSRGAILESPSHKFGNEPEEVFVESILAATAELERNQNKRQVRNRMQARLEAGYWPFYPPPGYTFAKVPGHGKILVPDEPEASMIREALEGYANGRFANQVDVQAFLQGRGYKHRRERGKSKPVTYLEQVKRLLTREVYAGYIHYPPWNVARRVGQHQRLISPETFDRIQDRLKEKEKVPSRKDINKDFPLRGFVLCNQCRHPFTASWSKGKRKPYPYYYCNSLGCGQRYKAIRAEQLHREFETILLKLRPRERILHEARNEFLALWDKRMLDVAAVRKERQNKLASLDAQIQSYLAAIDKCSSPTVIKRIEEKVDDLEAKKLRLGGKIEEATTYDFAGALDLVLDFLRKPGFVWITGDLTQKQMVLRLVFTEPLIYERKKGFQTPQFSLPIAISCILELDKMEMVDMVRHSWNTLVTLLKEWAEQLRALPVAEVAKHAA